MFVTIINLIFVLIAFGIPLMYKYYNEHKIDKDDVDSIVKDKVKNVNRYVWILILVFFLVIPWLLKKIPYSFSPTAQLSVAVMVTILDWISLHQDKTRYSEKDICLFGNCRKNALITGILAHVADVIGIAMIVMAFPNEFLPKVPIAKILPALSQGNVEQKVSYFVFYTVLAGYTGLGCWGIYEFLKDGGESDISNLSDSESCKKNDIMGDAYRGLLNTVITFFGVYMGWQAIFEFSKTQVTGQSFALSQWLEEIFKFLKSAFSSSEKQNILYKLLHALFVVIMAIVPTYLNQINTSYQYAASAKELGLPDCFD